jgi:tRNA pseudouridine55 synthase
MDGKPLYEYARENKPLPRAIDPRAVTVSELVLEEFTPAQIVAGDGGHTYETPTKHLSAEELETYRKLTELTKVDVGDKTVVGAAGIPDAKQEEQAAKEEQDAKKESEVAEDVKLETATSLLKPPTFKLRMTVTSGTYVRSIVHDVGLAIGSAAHVVKLTRTRQGQFALEAGPEKLERDSECYVHDENGPDRFDFGERKGGVIPWDVLERAIKQRKAEIEKEKQDADAMASGEMDEEEMTANQPENGKWRPKEWEREFYARFVSTV